MNNLNRLTKKMVNFVLNNNNNSSTRKKKIKKSVSFRNNHTKYNIPKEAENVEARKSITNRTPITSENDELYASKRASHNENKIRRRLTKQYLKMLQKKGKYHLNNTNKNHIEEMVEKTMGTF